MVAGVRVPVLWTVERAAAVLTCSFSPDGSQVLCGGDDKNFSLLDTVTGKQVWTVDRAGNVLTCAFSPDGSQVLCGGNDKKLSLLRPGLTSPCGAFNIKDFITSTFAKLVDISLSEEVRQKAAESFKESLSKDPLLRCYRYQPADIEGPSVTVLQHAIDTVGVRPFGIVAFLLDQFPALCLQIDTDGRTSFDIALEAKDSGALALLFKALTDERVHALFRGCFVENVCKVLRQYPLAVEVLGPAFESVKTEITIFSKEKEITRAHLRHTELCGHAERCGKSAESVWRNRDANGTVWPPAAVINDGSKDTLALGDQSSAEDDGNGVIITSKSPWQDDTNGVVVVSKCFDVPGVVNIELLQLLQENANNMSSTCRQQIFTSPVVEAALGLLWEEHAKKCWFRELVLYLCFLATLVVFSLSVNSTFHDGHDANGRRRQSSSSGWADRKCCPYASP
jgi:hypothetical protein